MAVTEPQMADLRGLILQLVMKSGHRIVNQSRDDTSLTQIELQEVLRHQLVNKPHIFLEKYHQFLTPEVCPYFENISQNCRTIYEEKSIVEFFTCKIKKARQASAKAKNNRRCRAMQKLMRETNFFTESQMRNRDPEAYDAMVGQFLSSQELESIISQPMASLRTEPRAKYDHLLETLDEQLQASCSTGNAKTGNDVEGYSDEEFDSDSTTEDDVNCIGGLEADCSETAKELRLREFTLYMQEKFLHGREKDIDYDAIDKSDANDSSDEKMRDEEEAWFDDHN